MSLPSSVCRTGLVVAALVALGGCRNPAATLSDTELAAVLGGGQDIGNNTMECLRAWSGDPSLSEGLPADYSGARKQDCRHTIESWLTVGARNPHHVQFTDLAAPAVVNRAIAIQQQQKVAAGKAAEAAAAERKRDAEVAAAAARKRATRARIASMGKEFDTALAQLRGQCTSAEDAIRNKRRVPDNLKKQIDGCSAKADAQQQQWNDTVARNDLTTAVALLKTAQESVTGAKSLAANAAKIRR
jgi:hypothetical protein